MTNAELKEIFDHIIFPESQKILDKNSGLLLVDNAFELLSFEYNALHEYYLKKYMHPNSKGLDVHKEISAILISLLKVKILKTISSDYYGRQSIRHAFNETLAFRVGCGILYSTMRCDFKEKKDLSEDKKKFYLKQIEQKGLRFPKTTYQKYCPNTITEFYYTSREGSYNFLALADKFFWIDYYNRDLLENECKKPKKGE